MTQAQINDAVNSIVNQYTGQSVGYQGTYFNQCTVPVCYYVDLLTGETRAPSMTNDRADGWGVQFPSSLSPYFTHEHFQPGKAYPVGTILMWNSPHIAIVLHSDGSNIVQVFEQNADPDGAPCKTASRVVNNAYHTCTYALVPVITAAPPPPPVNPITQYEALSEHTMQTNKQPTYWWNLNGSANGNFTPAATLGIHSPFVVAGIAHHVNGEKYAMEPQDFVKAAAGDYSTNNGVNIKDLEEIPAPLPPPPPLPPPAAPVAYTAATTYNVITSISGFKTAQDAMLDSNAIQAVKTGTYTQYGDTVKGQIPLLINPNSNPKLILWINPDQNKIEEKPNVPIPALIPSAPVPQPVPTVTQVNVNNLPTHWKETYKPFHPNAPLIPVKYVAIQDFVMRDLSGHRPDLHIPEDKEFGLYGIFTWTDGKKYFRAKTNGDVNFDYYYAVPTQHPEGGVGYVVTAGLLEIFPKPIQHWYVAGVGATEKAIDIVINKFRKRKV